MLYHQDRHPLEVRDIVKQKVELGVWLAIMFRSAEAAGQILALIYQSHTLITCEWPHEHPHDGARHDAEQVGAQVLGFQSECLRWDRVDPVPRRARRSDR